MTSLISHISIDCSDAYAISDWWKRVLNYIDVEDDHNKPGDEECMILSRDGLHKLLFIEVPENKTVKNRLHIDLVPTEGRRDAEYARLLELGASEIADHRGKYGPGSEWITLVDPEGNEFCILRNDVERSDIG